MERAKVFSLYSFLFWLYRIKLVRLIVEWFNTKVDHHHRKSIDCIKYWLVYLNESIAIFDHSFASICIQSCVITQTLPVIIWEHIYIYTFQFDVYHPLLCSGVIYNPSYSSHFIHQKNKNILHTHTWSTFYDYLFYYYFVFLLSPLVASFNFIINTLEFVTLFAPLSFSLMLVSWLNTFPATLLVHQSKKKQEVENDTCLFDA